MKLYDFFTSKLIPERYYRHIAFWLLRYLFLVQMIFGSMYYFIDLPLRDSIFTAFTIALYAVLAEIVFTYLIVYWLIPTFFKTNIFLFAAGLVLLSALLVIAESPVYIQWFNLESLPGYSFILIWECVAIITASSHVICVLFIACRLFKNYYLKMEEREILVQENARAEMQLLKAQVHPHFLFNTLNNIYSFALTKSPQSGDLVLKLSDALKYMIKDCDAPFVPVQKEIKLIEDYIGLEKVRYGDRLNMQSEIKGDCQDKFIAPLLLIPFVENSFKHGASKTLKHPWIRLEIYIIGQMLFMNLSNSKPLENLPGNGKNGIGLKNVQKRLQIIYPDEHKLFIQSTAGEFNIRMQIPLQQSKTKESFKSPKESLFMTNQNISYA